MATTRQRRKVQISIRDGVAVVNFHEAEAWDGADLVRLRVTITKLVHGQGRLSVGVNMRHVRYIPPGFFGELYDWHERGCSVWIYRPRAAVRNMLWFRQFAEEMSAGCYLLRSGGELELPPAGDETTAAPEPAGRLSDSFW